MSTVQLFTLQLDWLTAAGVKSCCWSAPLRDPETNRPTPCWQLLSILNATDVWCLQRLGIKTHSFPRQMFPNDFKQALEINFAPRVTLGARLLWLELELYRRARSCQSVSLCQSTSGEIRSFGKPEDLAAASSNCLEIQNEIRQSNVAEQLHASVTTYVLYLAFEKATLEQRSIAPCYLYMVSFWRRR